MTFKPVPRGGSRGGAPPQEVSTLRGLLRGCLPHRQRSDEHRQRSVKEVGRCRTQTVMARSPRTPKRFRSPPRPSSRRRAATARTTRRPRPRAARSCRSCRGCRRLHRTAPRVRRGDRDPGASRTAIWPNCEPPQDLEATQASAAVSIDDRDRHKPQRQVLQGLGQPSEASWTLPNRLAQCAVHPAWRSAFLRSASGAAHGVVGSGRRAQSASVHRARPRAHRPSM